MHKKRNIFSYRCNFLFTACKRVVETFNNFKSFYRSRNHKRNCLLQVSRGRGSWLTGDTTTEELEKARDYLDKDAWTRRAFSFNMKG